MSKPYANSMIALKLGVFVLVGTIFSHDGHAQRSIPLPPPPPIIWPDERPTEPKRWTEEDVTLEQKFETARKESVAAYQIAQDECKKLAEADRAVCMAQARLEYEREMSAIKTKFGMTR